MAILWIREERTKNAGIVDIAWSWGLGAVALVMAATQAGDLVRRVMIAVMGGIWAFRLGFYLWSRVGHEKEDVRYQSLREKWGANASIKFFMFFQFQALLVALFAIPFVVVSNLKFENQIRIWDWLAVAIWVIAVGGETIADRQLSVFRARLDSKGKTCQEGLWKYSRHPNYFFEWLHWFSYVAIAAGSPYGWIAWWGPIFMLLFLIKITGIPLTEERLKISRPDYADYQQRTSAFIPWFRKN